MKTFAWLAVFLAVVCSARADDDDSSSSGGRGAWQQRRQNTNVLKKLTRQVMLQQFYLEEKVRSDGNSGLKTCRLNKEGTKNFYQPSIADRSYLAMHDHPNYASTAGSGEYKIVMNGVEFRTRHNDYKLRMPSTTTKNYQEMENIPFPDVPPSVLSQKTVEGQIKELRMYFKAFAQQDASIREYRPYFKANLCYLEGAWTLATDKLEEPFQSDRHFIDADSWYDLMDKIRFTAYTGSKDLLENYAYLPLTIYNVSSDGVPQYAQWNYRVLCHPLPKYLPTKYFHTLDDLMHRFPQKSTMDQLVNSKTERFYLDKEDIDHYSRGDSLLDDLMNLVPGMDNYQADLADDSLGVILDDVRYKNSTLLNTGYYHRYFRTRQEGAMGTKNNHRGFSDSNLFVAQNTQPKVAPMSAKKCNKYKKCKYWTTRYSYALPMEVIYMTPLMSWNPYNIPIQEDRSKVYAGGRNGGDTKEKAYNGAHPKRFYYRTPVEFFSGVKSQRDPADTARRGVSVLDKDKNVRQVTSSGIRVILPDIEGVGQIRLRYPIMPVHGEGNPIWKELNALKEMTMRMNRFASLFTERPGQALDGDSKSYQSAMVRFELRTTFQDPPGEHSHQFSINVEEYEELKKGQRISVTTTVDLGHSHDLILFYRRGKTLVIRCDDLTECWDGHSRLPRRLR